MKLQCTARGFFISLVMLAACTLVADERPASLPCGDAADCGVSAHDWKQARAEFRRGVRLKTSGQSDEALTAFRVASDLAPRNAEFAAAREFTRQALVLEHIERGNRMLEAEQRIAALGEFRAAAELDPSNEFALQRMRDALGDSIPALPAPARVVLDSPQIHLTPQPGTRNFHYRGDARGLLTTVAQAYGIALTADSTVQPRPARFDLERADYDTAMSLAARVTKTFLVVLGPQQVLAVNDTPDQRQALERMALETFYLPEAATPAELNDYSTVLRTLFDLRFVAVQAQNNSIAVRGPQAQLELAASFLESSQMGAPQVMLDVYVYQISRTATRAIGVDLPLQFQMFNLPAAALLLAANPNLQGLINQLFTSGAINQANGQAIQALLAQLGNQQNSIFSHPFASFGGGLTRFGVSVPPATARLALNESNVRQIEHLTLRAGQSNEAVFRVGSRFPILNASFSPIFNSAAISQVIANNSFTAPFPSFSYEDLGLTLKATPVIHGDAEVTLKLELQLKSLTGQTFNSVPVISNRDYSGSVTLRNGERAVIAGMMTLSDARSLSGLPGLGQVPGLGRAVSSETKNREADEVLVTVTPHILTPANATGTMLRFKNF